MSLRVTQQFASVAYTESSKLRVTRQIVEVLIHKPAANAVLVDAQSTLSLTSDGDGFKERSGTGESTLVLSQEATGIIEAKHATNTLTITQDATADREGADATANTLTITQDIEVLIAHGRTPSNALSITQSADASGPKNASASNTLTLTQIGYKPVAYDRSPSNRLFPTQSAIASGPKVVFASNVLAIVGSVDSTEKRRQSAQSLVLTQLASVVKSKVAKNRIVFTQSVDRDIRATGVSSLVALTQRAEIPWGPSNTITLSQLAEVYREPRGFFSYDDIDLSQVAIAGINATRSLSQTIPLKHAVAYLLRPAPSGPIVPISVTIPPDGLPRESPFDRRARKQGNYWLCNYAPFVGATTDPDAPAPPPTTIPAADEAVTKGIRLRYPAVAPTDEVIVERSMSIGDILRFGFDRVARESRGGTQLVYVDPDWPTRRVLSFSASGVKRTTALAVLHFVEATLGYQIGILTHEGRLWQGLVINPQDAIVQDHRDSFTIYIELEGNEL